MINGCAVPALGSLPAEPGSSSRRDDISGGKADIESITVTAPAIKQLQILKHPSSRSAIGSRDCFSLSGAHLNCRALPRDAARYPGLITYWQLTRPRACTLATHAPPRRPRAHTPGGCWARGGRLSARLFLWPRPLPVSLLPRWPAQAWPLPGRSLAARLRGEQGLAAGGGRVLPALLLAVRGSGRDECGRLPARPPALAMQSGRTRPSGRTSRTPVVWGGGQRGVGAPCWQPPACPDWAQDPVASGLPGLAGAEGRHRGAQPAPGDALRAHRLPGHDIEQKSSDSHYRQKKKNLLGVEILFVLT